jgi:hypothetical protein
MQATGEAIPRWIYMYGGLLAVIGLAAGTAQYLVPSAAIPGLVVDSPADQSTVWQLAARSIAQAVALVVAIVLRSRVAIGVVFVMRAMTEFQDMLVALVTGVAPAPPVGVLAVFLVAFVGPELWAATILLRRR